MNTFAKVLMAIGVATAAATVANKVADKGFSYLSGKSLDKLFPEEVDTSTDVSSNEDTSIFPRDNDSISVVDF